MSEIKITIAASEIAEAINNLAKSLIGLAEITHPSTTIVDGVIPTHTLHEAAAQQATSIEAAASSIVPVSVPNTQNVSCPTPNVAPAQTVPTAAPQYTLDMIAKAGTALIDAGKMAELSALLAKYGVEALTALDPTHYGAFAAELRAMGASI